MINVCVVNPNYYRSSGITVAIKRIYESLPTIGITQYFVDCEYGNGDSDIDWIPSGRLAHFRLMSLNLVTLIRECASFVRWLRKNNIRIVHVHHRRLAMILYWLSFSRKYKLIYTANLTYPYAFWFWIFSPTISTAISPSVVENLKRTTRTTNIRLISNGCNFPTVCPPVHIPRVNKTAICIARFDPVKGHDKLLDAWRILLDRGHQCRLLLVGEGGLRLTLERQAKTLGIGHAVEFRGFHKNVIPQIEQALFAVLPSQVEGQGIVTIEAAAQGRPSLLTNVDGSRDCVPPNVALPNLIEWGDVLGLADALAAWFAQPDLVVADGRIFYEYLKNTSSSATVGNDYTSLYEQVVAD